MKERLRTDKLSYRIGEPVIISFSIENEIEEEITLLFSSGQHYDLWARLDGEEIWRWSYDKRFIEAFTSIKLKPGETRTFEVIWHQVANDGKQAQAGSYEVCAQLTTVPPRPSPISTEIELFFHRTP